MGSPLAYCVGPHLGPLQNSPLCVHGTPKVSEPSGLLQIRCQFIYLTLSALTTGFIVVFFVQKSLFEVFGRKHIVPHGDWEFLLPGCIEGMSSTLHVQRCSCVYVSCNDL